MSRPHQAKPSEPLRQTGDCVDDQDKHKVAIGAMVAEVGRLGDAIAERLSAAERFVAVAGAFAGAGLTLGLFQRQKGVLVGLPVAIGIIYLFMIQIYTDASVHVGHRRALEERLANLLSENALVGQRMLEGGYPRGYSRRLSIPLTFGLVIIVWIVTVATGAQAAMQLSKTLPEFWRGALLVVGVLLLIYLIATVWVAMRENSKAETVAYRLASDALTTEVAKNSDAVSSTQGSG
jgi:hypothetical protein